MLDEFGSLLKNKNIIFPASYLILSMPPPVGVECINAVPPRFTLTHVQVYTRIYNGPPYTPNKTQISYLFIYINEKFLVLSQINRSGTIDDNLKDSPTTLQSLLLTICDIVSAAGR